tara:strand:+ start:78 stop:332 length:255 start_codon:yes stop_codon:yes gene_type:complete
MKFFQDNLTAICSAAIIGMFSFIVTVNSDVAVLKGEAGSRKEADSMILKEIRFVKVHQLKMDEKITDTRERVIRLESLESSLAK